MTIALHSAAKYLSAALSTAVVLTVTLLGAHALAADGNPVASSSVTSDHDTAHLVGHHHYESSAEEANDALLITEVKSALADDGVGDDSAIVVDCDHGKVLLSGVMKSADDASHAGDIAAHAPGVVAVKNQLTWH